MSTQLLVGLSALFLAGLVLGLRVGRWWGRRQSQEAARSDAVKRSRAVLGGLVGERFAPHFKDFPYDPTEVRFLGHPVDYVAFKGTATGEVSEVAFIEVKTGGATLTKGERSLRDAVQAGRVTWVEYRVE